MTLQERRGPSAIPHRIAFDARLFGAPPTGIGRWTRGLLAALVRAAPGRTFVALGPEGPIREALGRPANLEVVESDPRRNLLWQWAVLPGLLLRSRVCAFLSVWNLVTSPAGCRTQVAWLHDLIPFQATAWGFRATYRFKTLANLQLARRRTRDLVVVSRHTRERTLAARIWPAGRVHVIHPGLDHAFFRPAGPVRVAEVRSRHGLAGGYLLAVGGAEPRKNLALAVEAWRRVDPARRAGVELALAGGDFRGRGLADGAGEAAGVRALGRVADPDLPALYTGAAGLVYPSLAEGFGLPPVEAMACGTPVIAADSTSIPEAAGGAALLARPEPAALARAIERLLAEPGLACDLVRKGLARAAELTWERAAERALEVLDRAHRGGRRA